MSETKRVLKRLALCYLMLIITIIPCVDIIPDIFPIRNLSSIYLLTVCVCLILYYSYRVSQRGTMKKMLITIAWLELIFILLRALKYVAVQEVDVLIRYTWYLFYVPILFIPVVLLYIALLLPETGTARISKKWYFVPIITVLLFLFVLTNDMHQLVFVFNPGMVNWETDYSYGPVFYVLTVWRYAVYLLAVALMIHKCRVVSSRKNSWMILIPLSTGIFLQLLLILGKMPEINGCVLLQFPETVVFTVSAMIEICMQLGLIPTNEGYGKLFRVSSLSAQITDRRGTPVYKSETAADITPENITDSDGARIGEHTVLRRMDLPGGYGFWQDDVTELDLLNEKLEDAKEQLTEEAELTRLQNEIQEKQAVIEQRSHVYDNIALRTQAQSRKISLLADEALASSDAELTDRNRKEIALLGAYIKRYANLMLLSADNPVIEVGDLALSVSEMLRYLNLSGISVEMLDNAKGTVTAASVFAVMEVMEELFESNLKELTGVTVRFTNKAGRISCLAILENLRNEPSEEAVRKLRRAGIKTETVCEDEITYYTLILPEGDAAV